MMYGKVLALHNVDLVVPPGEFVGLIGHNGAGKSTLLRIVMGLLAPDSGRVSIAGVDVFADPAGARRHLGAVPEEPAVYEFLSAREHLEFVAEVRGVGDVGAALEVADLGSDADRPIREYSQGMRRRTALAAALLHDPALLVLDEALNGLDPPSAARVRGLLRARVEAGRSVVLSTHVAETVERVADRIVVLARGRVAADVRPGELGDGGLDRLFAEILAPTVG